MRLVRAFLVLAASVLYLAYVFQFSESRSWTSGLGDWHDPYFINALMENWYRSATHLTDPSSPPMYFPVQGTLAYSHGLVLYAPFYVTLRLFLHPFHAYTLMLFAVMQTGILCLYLLLRTLRLSFIESLLLSAFFLSSRNVVHGETGVWSQRASVFLIPPILLVLVVSARMRPGRARLVLAGVAGMLSTLMYVQDFYTAHFALLFATILAFAVAVVDCRAIERVVPFYRAQTRAAQAALAIAGLTAAWACALAISGGGELHLLGVTLRSHDWGRPTLAALAAFVVFLGLSGLARAGIRLARGQSWLWAVGLGTFAGSAVFLWLYLGAYREHPAFPEANLLGSLVLLDPSRWDRSLEFIRDLGGYNTLRSFALVLVVGTMAWIPWFNVERRTRIYCVWFLALSFVVLLIPLRFQEFSVWRVVFQRLPGFGAIRDPKRIIQVYELAVVLVTGLFLARLPAKSAGRISIAFCVLALLVWARNREKFDYERPVDLYERWVAAPIDVDPACRSFYIKGASQQYMSRSPDMWSLYGVDSMFVALNHGIPTLNGYSAWFPDAWNLHNPQEPEYPERVRRWIDATELAEVCELDIDARTMRLRR